eukprot:17622_1
MSTDGINGTESWQELLEDEKIEYSDTELHKLREKNKNEWRKYLNLLLESEQWKSSWSWKGSKNFRIAAFEPHHKKEALDMIMYQFSSCGNNTFHKILDTPVGGSYNDCIDCLNHICLTGLGYVLLNKYNHVDGVFYGWDLRDEPHWNEDKYGSASKKEDQIIRTANKQNTFSHAIFEKHTNRVKYGRVFFGEILCVKPHLMGNGWFTKLSFNISLLFGMKYEVYYDFDFQPNRHIYKQGVFDNLPVAKTAILRYDLFYFGDFIFEDGSKMDDNYNILQKNGFKDVENLKKNAYVGCFILRNSKELKQFFNNDFLKVFECVLLVRNTQEKILMQLKNKKKGLWNYWTFMMSMYWNGILLFLFAIKSNQKIKRYVQVFVALLMLVCILVLL